MVSDEFNDKFDRFTLGIVRRKVRQLIGRAGYTRHDRQDLEQDFYVRILQSLLQFNPGQGHRNKFVTTVVERHFANILRNKQAEKRDHRRIGSLNVIITVAGDRPTEFAHTVAAQHLDARLGRQQLSDDELVQLAIDLADMTATLPELWQRLLELRKSKTMTEAARAMGVPRTTLNSWMRRIRQRLEKTGLKDYL